MLNNSYEKTSSVPMPTNKLSPEESNKIMSTLVEKIAKKIDTINNPYENLTKTSIFNKLLHKMENQVYGI